MMHWYTGDPGWAGWLAMTTLMLAFWALLIFGGLAVVRGLRPDNPAPPSRPDPEQLLDERFARGEIDADDYTQRRQLLRAGS